MVRKFAVICLAAAIAGAGASLPAYAGSATSAALNAKEATQLLNKGHLISQVNELVTQTKQQIQMYANMVTNTIGLPVAELREVRTLAETAYNLYNSAESIAYGVLSDGESFARNWEGWFPDATQREKETIAECVDRDEKCTESLAGISGNVAKGLKVHMDQIDTEAKYRDVIAKKLETAEGQKQVCQVLGHELNNLSGQLTTLEKAAVEQNMMMASMMAERQEEKQLEKTKEQHLYNKVMGESTGKQYKYSSFEPADLRKKQ